MEVSNEQPAPTLEPATNTEQETTEEPTDETEDYNFDGDDYRPFIPRGRGGFR